MLDTYGEYVLSFDVYDAIITHFGLHALDTIFIGIMAIVCGLDYSLILLCVQQSQGRPSRFPLLIHNMKLTCIMFQLHNDIMRTIVTSAAS